MSLGLIADDQGPQTSSPGADPPSDPTRTEKQNKKETTISVDANLLTM